MSCLRVCAESFQHEDRRLAGRPAGCRLHQQIRLDECFRSCHSDAPSLGCGFGISSGPMANMSSSEIYYGCGLAFESEIPLIGIPRSERRLPSATVRLGRVSEPEQRPFTEADWFYGEHGQLKFQIPGVARYCISNGSVITVDPQPGADELDVQVFLMGSAFGALLHQRDTFPLHASSVRVGDSYVAFVGHSGDGKSTQAAMLHRAGFTLAGDDICPVQVSPDDEVSADFGFTRLKLWSDTLDSLGIEKGGLKRASCDRDKYELPTLESILQQRLPLKAIYVLGYADAAEESGIERVTGQRSLPLLLQHTYRYCFVEPLGCTERHFCHCLSVARTVPIFQLRRPRGFEFAQATIEMLQDHWEGIVANSSVSAA